MPLYLCNILTSISTRGAHEGHQHLIEYFSGGRIDNMPIGEQVGLRQIGASAYLSQQRQYRSKSVGPTHTYDAETADARRCGNCCNRIVLHRRIIAYSLVPVHRSKQFSSQGTCSAIAEVWIASLSTRCGGRGCTHSSREFAGSRWGEFHSYLPVRQP